MTIDVRPPLAERSGSYSRASILPDEVIEQAVTLDMSDSTVVYDDADGKISEIHFRREHIPKVGQADLGIYYVEDKEHGGQSFSFMYSDPHEDQRIATFTARRITATHFSLTHRLVEPDYRDRGVGSRLLKHVEQFMTQMAEQLDESITLDIQIAQRGVMEWAMKNGYEPIHSSDQDLVLEIFEHPEHFEIQSLGQDAEFKDNYVREEYIFRPETKERNSKTAIRIPFVKIFGTDVN